MPDQTLTVEKLTPHIGAYTDGANAAMGVAVVDDIARVLAGEEPRNRVTAFVPGVESPPARRQISGAVRRVTVVAEVASAPPGEASVVAIAPDGAERVLVAAGTAASREIRATVRTAHFFSKPGDYRMSLRHRERTLAEGLFTVARDEESAVVNACVTP